MADKNNNNINLDDRELRWFFNGDIPDAVLNWFSESLTGHHLDKSKPRIDLYFLVMNKPDFGVKLRERKLELKWRTDKRSFSALNGKVVGMQSNWEKQIWKFGGDHAEMLDNFMGKKNFKGPRKAVEKTRLQRKYAVEGSNTLTPVPIDNRDHQKVSIIELTYLKTSTGNAWTLGFDIIAPQETTDEVLHIAVNALLEKYPGPPLTMDSWAGYPKWLLDMHTSNDLT